MRLSPGLAAVVTGGASGIGRALAFALADRGLRIALTDVEAPALSQAAGELRSSGAEVVERALDVAEPSAVSSFASLVDEWFGPVDLICNVAGVVGPRLPTWEQSAADWQWIWQVNVFGVANVLRAFLPPLVARGTGHIVNVSSIAGLAPVAGGGNAPYAASKYAVVGLSETLRVELDAVAPSVGVTVVCPGPVATRIRDAARNRPPSLGGSPDGVAGPRPSFTNVAARIDPADAAAQILAAVEDDRFYLLTNPENGADARARIDRLRADLP
jgi:NAD(P)-dependent dehydrogenase (short-subunit alcohol dehydrogenase family)